MAKRKTKKSSNLTPIVSLICLVLSVLMVVSFFIPIYTYGDESAVKVNGVTLTEATLMSEEARDQAGIDSINFTLDKSDRQKASRLATVYDSVHSEENASAKLSVFASWIVVVAGVVGIVCSIITYLGKKVNLGLVISTGVGMLGAILLVIFASSTVSYIAENAGWLSGVVNAKTGFSIWMALVSSILATGTAVTGKLLKK